MTAINPFLGILFFKRLMNKQLKLVGKDSHPVPLQWFVGTLLYVVFIWELKLLPLQPYIFKVMNIGTINTNKEKSAKYFRYSLYSSTIIEVLPQTIG